MVVGFSCSNNPTRRKFVIYIINNQKLFYFQKTDVCTTKYPFGNCYLLFESSEHLEDFQGSTIKETLSLLVFVYQFPYRCNLEGYRYPKIYLCKVYNDAFVSTSSSYCNLSDFKLISFARLL